MTIKTYYTITVFTLIFFLSGCSDSLLNENPPHLISTESLYTNYDGFETGLNGLYSLVRDERYGRGGTNYLRAGLSMNGTDNMTPNYRHGFGGITEEWDVRNDPQSSHYDQDFSWLYDIVNSANTIINQAQERTDVDWSGGSLSPDENKNMVIAEARAIRAWAYRHLTYLWSDVPLTLEESRGSTIKTDWERTPVGEVREQMKSDWLFAEQRIPVEPRVRGRISKGAIQHYLSELYLAEEKPDSALYWANECINTPDYQLITERYGVRADQPGVPFMDMFYPGNSNREEGNTEALWVFQFEFETVGGGASIMRRWHSGSHWHTQMSIGEVNPIQFTLDRGGRGLSRMALTKWAIDLYEPQDDRGSNYAIRKFYILKNAEQNAPGDADRLPPDYAYGDTLWLDWTNDLTTTTRRRENWPFSRKWDSTPETDLQAARQFNDQVYLRLAETYLLKAEAQYKLGNSAGAAETINIIRRRSNASDITAGDIDIDFILDERSRELVVEEQRRYTLLRTNKWLERVQMYNHNGGQTAAARDTIYPIPQTVIDANLTHEMRQNPGYN